MKETGSRDPAETCFNVSGRGRSDECGQGRESLRRVGNWGCRSKSEDANALLAHALWERILHRKFFKDSYLSSIFVYIGSVLQGIISKFFPHFGTIWHWILCIVVYGKQKNHSYHNVHVHNYVHCISNAKTVLAYSFCYRLEKVNPSEKEIKSCQLSRHDID